ncbi:MAG: dTMP kinase [Chlamydiota bacterium]
MFITFEGGDGAGKTTLIERVYQALKARGENVMKTRAPGSTAAGSVIRELLLHHEEPLCSQAELLLYLADRAEHVSKIIKPALEQNIIVLCDRFNDSTVAYQGAGRGLDPHFVCNLAHFATQNLEPDLTLYLDLDPEVGLDRVKKAGMSKDKIESEKLEFHQKIRAAFHTIAKNEPTRFHVIDASESPDRVFQKAFAIITQEKRC